VTHREPTSTGARSQEFGKQTSVGHIEWVLLRCNVERRCVEWVPSPKETATPLGTDPDDGDRQREGEGGVQGSRETVKK